MLGPIIILDDFFDHAGELRASFDRHFAEPHQKGAAAHQVWDYWYVPGLYTYLRTDPTRVLPALLVGSFVSALRAWAMASLGMSWISPLWLSIYVDGCGQELHNDSGNGRWGFVYSLTRWDERRFLGGETLILKDSGYWETDSLTRPGAGVAFYDLVPARFNRLLVFDDCFIHAVPRIQGTMVPQDARVVIHGHIREEGIDVRGALSPSAVEHVLAPALARINARFATLDHPYHGCVCVRLETSADGRVQEASTLSDRVYRISSAVPEAERVSRDIAEVLADLRFPATGGPSTITVPVALS